MLARLCDGCKKIITEKTFVQLTKTELETDKDNHQEAKYILGDYCDTCLNNGNALKDLLYGAN